MALIVEDGTGLATAESYISVADADAYITAYKGSDATWGAATEAAKEIAARVAMQYLDGAYNWKGEKYSAAQAGDFPRNFLYDVDGTMIEGVPQKLKYASAEVMYLHVKGTTLTVDVDRSKQVKREKVDVIEVEYEAGASQQPVFPVISRLLSDYVRSSGRIQRS